MEYFLLVISVFLGTTKSILSKTVKSPNERAHRTLFSNAVMFTVAFIVVTLIGMRSFDSIQNVPFFLSLGYAICTVGGQVALMQAVSMGSVSISSLFYSCGFLLPTLFGTIYYTENFHFLQGIGIFLIVIAFLLSIEKSDKKFSVKWLIYALLGLFFSGMVGIIQKLFVKEYQEVSLDIFLSVSFAFMIFLSGMLYAILLIYAKKKASDTSLEKSKTAGKTWIALIVLGGTIGLANKLNTYLTGVLPSVVSFPVINGGTIFLTSIVSMSLFKEKLSVKQKVAIVIGIVAILCIGIGKTL